MMTDDNSLREIGMHPLHQLSQGTNLLRRSGIDLLPRSIQTTLIADANGVAIMPHDMGPHLFEASSCEDLPLTVHPEMIADTLPALGLVVVVNLLDSVVLIGSETIAMQHDHSYFSHHIIN